MNIVSLNWVVHMRGLIFVLFGLFSSVVSAEVVVYEGSLDHLNDGGYVLGAGDMLRISVYGSPDLNTEVRISEAGTVNFPLLGEVLLSGLSPKKAEEKISNGLVDGQYVKQPHVNLVVLEYLSQFVSILGNVYKPGRFPLDRSTTLSDALALAGGITPNGSDIVTLSRVESGKTVKRNYDLREILSKGVNTEAKNPRVLSGDIVYVKKAPVFYIYGEVQRPGAYKLERDMSVAQALSIGGGLTARGTERGIEIKRIDKNGNLKTLDADISDRLQENDIVEISESWF